MNEELPTYEVEEISLEEAVEILASDTNQGYQPTITTIL